MTPGHAILVVDDDPTSTRDVDTTLAEAGFATKTAQTAAQALQQLRSSTDIGLILVGLKAGDLDEMQLLRHLRSSTEFGHIPVLVVATEDHAALAQALELGADDYVVQARLTTELIPRVRHQLQAHNGANQRASYKHSQAVLFELTQALASTLEIHDILFLATKRISEISKIDRCSIVLTNINAPHLGLVLASSDDDQIRDLPIELDKYPEIREVLSTAAPLPIEDTSQHPLLAALRRNQPTVDFASILVTPILQDREPTGVLFLRSRARTTFDQEDLLLHSTLANAIAIALRNARLWRTLRDETIKNTTARVEAERRLLLFQRYADLFESAADGMVVVDRAGDVLFANPRARALLRAEESQLFNCHFLNLVHPRDRDLAERLIGGLADGIYPRVVDLALAVNGQDPIIASLSFSPVFHEDNAILFSFRDVTEDRRIANELKKTKEFLERVIDSSIDAIVFCDMEGVVLLFNRAASRIFRYQPSEVIGKMRVDSLYPPGVARDVMRRIRDPDAGGYGRLEGYRVDMVSAQGEIVPVILSAALVVENGSPVGSVGVFTDIRERLRMEARLMTAQEELRTREKQVIVAELAGAAAHELNQPLTSVIGYAELLRRNLDAQPELQNASRIIITEAERMAEIVRKVGKITHYETKSYVGEAKILDLEKATDPVSGCKEREE